MQSLELTKEEQIEVISIYSSPEKSIDPVVSSPGWVVVGAFQMPITATIRLELIGLVSDASLTMNARLYCVTPAHYGTVSGSAISLTSLLEAQEFSGLFELLGNRLYQVQVEVVGHASGSGYSGVVHRVAPLGN
jgi:hypothetical protein